MFMLICYWWWWWWWWWWWCCCCWWWWYIHDVNKQFPFDFVSSFQFSLQTCWCHIVSDSSYKIVNEISINNFPGFSSKMRKLLLFCSSVNVKSNLLYLNYVIRWKHLYVGTSTEMYSSVSSISVFSLLLFSVACIRIDSNNVILHINGFVDLKH